MRVLAKRISKPLIEAKWYCFLFGHDMNNLRFTGSGTPFVCECGQEILAEGITRIRHIVKCFLDGHAYVFVTERDGHREFACTRCGHPLLFSDQKTLASTFKKKVRYLCNLFGHSVHLVTQRNDFFEYACFCGHTFVKDIPGRRRITHPPVCLFAGHFVNQIAIRNGCSEFACRNCGHTFLIGKSNEP